MAGIPLKRFLFRRNLEIPGVEEATPPGLPPPQDVDTSFLGLGQPPVPEDAGAIEGGDVTPQIAQPSAPPAAARPAMISPAVKAQFQRPKMEGLPPLPTFEPLPKFEGPKGLRQILMYGIPGYAQGRTARFEHEQQAAKYANELKARAYTEQLGAAREARMQETGIANLQQRFENFSETVRNHLEKEGISKQANELRKNAELNKLSQRAMWVSGYYANRTDIPEEEKQIGIRKFLGLGTTQQLNYSTLLDMAGGDPAMIEALPDEVKKMFGALPPAGPVGAQPSTTTHYGGFDYYTDPATGKVYQIPKTPTVSVRTPGVGGLPPVQPTLPAAAPATGGAAPFEPISLKAVAPGTVADPETERQIRSLAAQGGKDPDQLRQEMGYAPFGTQAAPTGAVPAIPGAAPTAGMRELTGPGGQPLIPSAQVHRLTDLQKEKLVSSVAAFDNTIDLTRYVLKNSNLLDSLITAGKIKLAVSPDTGKLILSRMMSLTPQEAEFAGKFQSLSEHINTLRLPLGAQGFRSEQAWDALQSMRSNLLANPEISRTVMRTTLQALLGQKSAAYISIAKSEARPFEIDDDTIRAYLDATGKKADEAMKLAKRHGWTVR
jgi:hypothetical protein